MVTVDDTTPGEAEAAARAAAFLAERGMLPSRRTTSALCGVGDHRSGRAIRHLKRRGDWPYPPAPTEGFRAASADDLGPHRGAFPMPDRPTGGEGGGRRCYYSGGGTIRERPDPAGEAARALEIRRANVEAIRRLSRMRDRPAPGDHAGWCRVYLSDWRARRAAEARRRASRCGG